MKTLTIIAVAFLTSCTWPEKRLEKAQENCPDCDLVYRDNPRASNNVMETFIFKCDSSYVVLEINRRGVNTFQLLP